MIINTVGGNPLLVGEIISTTRTISNSTYQYCDGSMIANPTQAIIDNAIARKQFAMGPAPSSTGTSMYKFSGPFYDGTYFIAPGAQASTQYPSVEVWTRGSNGVFTKNGFKVLVSEAIYHPADYNNCGSPVAKCGGYYYYVFNTTGPKTYVAYTTNPAGTWSVRQVDLSLAGVTINNDSFYSAIYTNDSKVRIVVTTRPEGTGYIYCFINYEFSGDVSNITFINTQSQSFSGQYWSGSSLPSRGIIRLGNYYVIGGFSDNFVYKTFTGSTWNILQIRGTTWYPIDNIGFDGTYYYRYDHYGSDSDYRNGLGYGTSFPGFYESITYRAWIPGDDEFPDCAGKELDWSGENTSKFGNNMTVYKGYPYIILNGGNSPYNFGIFKVDPANRTCERIALIPGWQYNTKALPDPTRPLQYVTFNVNAPTPRLIGPAVPDLTSMNRNCYMRIA